MTEEEAKTKWCPFGRLGAVSPADCGEVRGNRNMDGTPDPGSLCVASACMAWRATDNETFPSAPGEPDPPSKSAGYCGLAGTPHSS